MPAESIKVILSRAVAEPEFRSLLFREPNKAIEGYALTEPEIASLRALQPEAFDAMVTDLGVRMSQVTLPMLQADGKITDQGIASEVVLAHE